MCEAFGGSANDAVPSGFYFCTNKLGIWSPNHSQVIPYEERGPVSDNGYNPRHYLSISNLISRHDMRLTTTYAGACTWCPTKEIAAYKGGRATELAH